MLSLVKHQNRVFGQIYQIFIFRIYVESQFPPTAVNAAIEECLAEMDHYLRSTLHRIVGPDSFCLCFVYHLKSLQSSSRF